MDMIELPEAITIAQQIDSELKGKEISSGISGQTPHKFAFFDKKIPHTEFAKIIQGKVMGNSRAHGMAILTDLDPDYMLSLGCGGERIRYHTSEKTLPKKHQLKLDFHDDTFLTVTVSGWGEVRLLKAYDFLNHPHLRHKAISPLNKKFTFDYFNGLFDTLPKDKRTQKTSAKYFIISKPGVYGVGNGCLHDILFHARIHPKRQMLDLSTMERKTLYQSIQETLSEMVKLGGRESEYDLFNQRGGYKLILHSRVVGQPCPECGGTIQKIAYLGGSSYFCSSCQKEEWDTSQY
jgi:formamidopyrimidine-DNA glycosylase